MHSSSDLRIQTVDVERIIPLRHAVLRAGLPLAAARFPGDDLPTSRHWAALDHAGRVLGCATLHLNAWDAQPAYQLRGMAVAPDLQNRGVGRALVRAAEQFVASTPVLTLWCNARLPAAPFYARMGWRIVSEEFDIPTAGPHVKMLRTLPPPPADISSN